MSKLSNRLMKTSPIVISLVSFVLAILVSCVIMLLCGYDLNANTVTVCDPLEGKVDYDLDKFEDRYSLVYQQAVVIRDPDKMQSGETETETVTIMPEIDAQ